MNTRSLARDAVLLAVFAALLTMAAGPQDSLAERGHYEVTASQTLTSVAPGADRGSTTVLATPMGDHYVASNVVFDPLAVTYSPGCNIAGGRDRNNDGDALDGNETTVCLGPGDLAGSHGLSGKVGTANSACNSPLVITHDLFAVETPNNELDPRASTNIVWPRPQGSINRFLGWQVGSEPPALGGTPVSDGDFNTHADGNSLQFQNYPKYLLDAFDPDYTTAIDGPLPPVVPEVVYGGSSSIAGEWAPIYIAVFLSGQLNTAFAGKAPHPFTRFASSPASSSQGNPNLTLWGDPTAILTSQSGVSDFCSDTVSTSTLNATAGGISRAKNPPTAGTYYTLSYSAGQRDADNDGLENALDTCPKIANADDPRTTTGADLDGTGAPSGDMLDPACDPSPTGVGSSDDDQDSDGFPNALDNCPLDTNVVQLDSELSGGAPGYATAAFDGGPLPDAIGDGCDTGNTISASGSTLSPAITDPAAPTMVYTGADVFAQGDYIQIDSEIMRISDVTTATNTLIVGRGAGGTTAATHANLAPINDIVGITITLNGVSTPVLFTDTASTGHFHARGNVIPICYSTAPVDADGDGYCASGTAGCTTGACIVDAADSGACNLPPAGATLATCNVRHSAWTTTGSMALLVGGMFDTDRGGADLTGATDGGGIGTPITCPGGTLDLCPENAFDSDWLETYVYSDPAQACSQTSTLNDELFDAWAYDFNDDQRANLSDVVTMTMGRFVNTNFPSTGTPGYTSAVTLTSALGASSIHNTTFVYTGLDVIAAGNYITIDTEVLRVNSVDTATNTVDVARGVLGAPSPAAASAAHAAAAPILKTVGPRRDVNGDGQTNLSDVTSFGPFFNKQCRRVDGTFGGPQ